MSDSPIVLTLTIYPPKKNQRRVVVTGAPDGEMPLLLEGVFAERHALLDQAFTAVLKREPQVITLKADKAKASKPKSKAAADDDEAETGVADDVTAAADDPSGNISNDAVMPKKIKPITPEVMAQAIAESHAEQDYRDDDLPTIEGDTEATEDNEDEPVESSFVADDLPDEDEPADKVADAAYFAQPVQVAYGTVEKLMADPAKTDEE